MSVQSRADVVESREARQLRIVKALEEDIIFGRLAPGARLTEDALLARFPVTRHFVRQALVQLEGMGIVTRERNKGATVRSLSADQVRKIYAVRELLQRQAALQISLPAGATLIDELKDIQDDHDRYVEEGFLRGVHEANDRFHLTLFGACGNEYLVDSIKFYMQLTLPVRARTTTSRERLDVSRQHHRMMIDMLKGRDPWALAQLCVDHLQPSKMEYLRSVGPQADSVDQASIRTSETA